MRELGSKGVPGQGRAFREVDGFGKLEAKPGPASRRSDCYLTALRPERLSPRGGFRR